VAATAAASCGGRAAKLQRLLRLIGLAVSALAVVAIAIFSDAVPRAKPSDTTSASRLDRIVIIVLENHRSDTVDPSAVGPEEFTPFLNKLARDNRFATNYFGVWRPSLPNYLAMIGGDTFGVSDNAHSCFSPSHKEGCHSIDAPNLVDQLEEAQIAWEGLLESMPSAGFLGTIFSRSSKLYVQRHNPFVYFKSVALDPNRLAKLKPFILDDLEVELRDSGSASRFIYIVPNQCNNQHGTVGCEPMAARFAGGDAFLAQTVPAIINSPAFTNRSVLFVTWDNSYGLEACCGAKSGGGRIPLIAVTKKAMSVRATTPSDHYSLLATIEDGFGLPRIANAKSAATLFDLLPDMPYGGPGNSGTQ
jgi:hypothetical protein